jgi:hypothetical protein
MSTHLFVPLDENTSCFHHLNIATLGFLFVKDNYTFSLYVATYFLVHLKSSHVRKCLCTFYMARGKSTVSILKQLYSERERDFD